MYRYIVSKKHNKKFYNNNLNNVFGLCLFKIKREIQTRSIILSIVQIFGAVQS